MKSKMNGNMSLALACGAIALASGAAAAGTITEPVAVTLENVGQPVNYYSSLMLFPVTQTGDFMDTAWFDTQTPPGVFIGDESSNTPRVIQGFAFLDAFGEGPGNAVLRIDFPPSDPWGPNEMLSFRFVINFEEGELWKIDVQLTPVPAPGAIAALGLTGLLGIRRRR